MTTAATFFCEATAAFTADLDLGTLGGYARDLAASLHDKLSDIESLSMLPSFIDQTPTGHQTHLHDGELKEMGKNFRVGTELKGHSLNDCLTEAFQRAGLSLRPEAILNDSVSVLLLCNILTQILRSSLLLPARA
ncbi:N-acetylglucosamine kinase 1 [Sporothrix stenoceras]|uniref:N-acetylglucosamine kinase 1 n=1 Tax=Sporothrix stenoceras TaxID=5173 RepID=A0ABR3ZER3_9PEZI